MDEKHLDEKHFDVEQDKCILHCDKNENNNWYKLNDGGGKEWDPEFVKSFWAEIKKDLDNVYSNLQYESDAHTQIYDRVVFPEFQHDKEYNPHDFNPPDFATNFYTHPVYRHDDENSEPLLNRVFNDLNLEFSNCNFLEYAN
ncbi:hypothetical protein KKE54_08900, partial [bacterium]|nr:hypothetical protein [bacterium]